MPSFPCQPQKLCTTIGLLLISCATAATTMGQETRATRAEQDTQTIQVLPTNQLSRLKASLEQQLKELPPGKKADDIRKLLERLATATPASESPVADRDDRAPNASSGPAVEAERMLAEIEFRVALQQYEHLVTQIRELHMERALLEVQEGDEAELQKVRSMKEARQRVLEKLRQEVAREITLWHSRTQPAAPDPATRSGDGSRGTSIRGVCRDDTSGEPLMGVQVVIQRLTTHPETGKTRVESLGITKTDVQGRFTIADPVESLLNGNVTLRLVFVKQGYDGTERTLTKDSEQLANLEQRLKRRTPKSVRTEADEKESGSSAPPGPGG